MTRPPLHPLPSVLARVRLLLESPRLPLFVALVGALLVSPALFSGFATEDWVQRAQILNGAAPLPSHLNLFGRDAHFTDADTVKHDIEQQVFGWLPWVTDRHFEVSFFRPLASLTHHLDYRAWPNHPWIMHAESTLWYAAVIIAVALLYRRLLEPRWAAGLASFFYAVDDAHGHPVGWLINRNSVMATLFAVLSLLSYDLFRREKKASGAILTVLFLGLALGSGEFALCIGGYFVAYALFVDDAPPSRRLLAASTWIVTFLAWAVSYRWLTHQSHGSGLYIDPLHDPLAYGSEVIERSTVLLMGQFGAPFSDLWVDSEPYAQGLLVFWAAMLVWVMAFTLWPLFRHDRRARFWATGLLLSLLPASATFPEDRLLLLAGVGAFPVIALWIAALVDQPPWLGARRRSATVLGWALLFIHGAVAPLLLPYRSLKMFRYDHAMQAAGDRAFSYGGGASDEALIFVNARDYYFSGMTAVTRLARGQKVGGRMLTVAGTLEELVIHRPTSQSLEVRPAHGFLSRAFNRIYRSRALPFTRGEGIELLGIHVFVKEVSQWGEPLVAIFTFAFPLESSHYKWTVWKDGRYEPFQPPPVGATIVVGGT